MSPWHVNDRDVVLGLELLGPGLGQGHTGLNCILLSLGRAGLVAYDPVRL